MSANALAKALRVTPALINDIVRERRGITADTALRLARYFGTDARSWSPIKREAIQRMAKNSPTILPTPAEVKQQSYQTESAATACGGKG
jgi:addiction module HigA family antidote